MWMYPTKYLLAAFAMAAFGAVTAKAQEYPTRPITLVVPFVPGGSASVMARSVADKMSEALGQPIVVDNHGGAGSTLGARIVAKSRARRLHDPPGHQRHAWRGAQSLSQCRLRSAQGLCTHRPHRRASRPCSSCARLSRAFSPI